MWASSPIRSMRIKSIDSNSCRGYPEQRMTDSSAGLDRAPALVGPPGSRAAALTAAGHPLTMSLAILTCAVAPAYVLRWHLGPLPTTLLENALLLTIAAYVVESWRAGARPVWRTSLTIPAALF